MKAHRKALLILLIVTWMFITVGAGAATLVGHWNLDGNADDSIGNNDGVVFGALPGQGVLGGGFVFDGVDDYIALPQVAVTTTEFTVAAWANQYGQGGGPDQVNIIFSQRDDSTGNGRSAITLASESTTASPNPYAAAVIRSSTGSGQSATSASRGYDEWHHYAITVDSDYLIFYIDGIEMDKTPNIQSGNYTTSIDHITIGKEAYDGNDRRFFNGAIDDLRVYDGALSADAVAALVPEPGTVVLLGLGGLGLLRRRRAQ